MIVQSVSSTTTSLKETWESWPQLNGASVKLITLRENWQLIVAKRGKGYRISDAKGGVAQKKVVNGDLQAKYWILS